MTGLSMEKSAFVSVVVPCFNGIKTIPECLASLAVQTYPRDRFEVLLVDNGSQDGTCDYARSFFPWVKLVHCAEKGSGHARNAGIRESRGEFILSTDSDCVVDRAWITYLIELFEAAPPEVAAIGGRIAPYSLKTAVERYEPAWVSQPDIRKVGRRVSYTATPNAAFRAAALNTVGGFDGDSGHDDTDLGIRLIGAGFEIRYTDQAIVKHRNPRRLVELYEHREKYAARNLILGLKHPDVLGDPLSPGSEWKLLAITIRRVLGDLLAKLPKALLLGSKVQPRIWPLIDAVMAAGNFTGFYRTARAQRVSHLTASRNSNKPSAL
jgi:glycosyltransferase involved in cell wall biosynthesis